MMRAYDNGAFYSVSVGAREIADFADRWPCSGLRSLRSVWFQFDRRNGDLVDLKATGPYEDGPAMLALSQDAQAYARKRLRIP